ncbi:LysR family transcriptional regulator [Marinilactibacillus psychrotolerans]|uniref:LysR family transcriptional regulator n=2 Tax=Marinilactibacillus psychrotolerans TaxID=191770 RepID=A0A5R9BZ48_9LACT|nr:LysR family transcriptional regulator [Marinilactibacillus psychrotolerans]TLQ05927.1 LysR family transcriptional regulator [Marinilactibacillus psychrotolerans]SJN27822.1 Transcriptional regulator, LysR family [Marinilactibacillus psychrotolerans 42ea]
MLDKRILYFLAVVEEGSFSAAGKAHYITQSAISQQVASLENDLNIPLFDRTFYKPRLTKAGEKYYTFCKDILHKEVDVLNEMYKLANTEEEILHIGITGPLESKHLPNIIVRYEKLYPDKVIKVTKCTFLSGVDQLLSGELDVAFGISNDLSYHTTIAVTELIKHKICVICSPEHPLAKRRSIDSKELKNVPVVSLSKESGPNFYADFMRSFREDGFTPNIVKYVDNLEELILDVRLNRGIAWTSKEVINETDKVHILDINDSHHGATFAVGRRKRNLREDVKVFIDLCSDYFSTVS